MDLLPLYLFWIYHIWHAFADDNGPVSSDMLGVLIGIAF